MARSPLAAGHQLTPTRAIRISTLRIAQADRFRLTRTRHPRTRMDRYRRTHMRYRRTRADRMDRHTHADRPVQLLRTRADHTVLRTRVDHTDRRTHVDRTVQLLRTRVEGRPAAAVVHQEAVEAAATGTVAEVGLRSS